jgi:hypothetical protein
MAKLAVFVLIGGVLCAIAHFIGRRWAPAPE